MPNGYVSPAADFGQVREDKDGGNLAPAGRVMEILSEHTVEGWLEGYPLGGHHSVYARVRILRAKSHEMALRLLWVLWWCTIFHICKNHFILVLLLK
jgi:hypothetical protein